MKNHQYDLYLANLLSGFFIISLVPFFFGGFQLKYIVHPYRIITVVLSFLVIVYNFRKINKPSFLHLLLLFFILYLLRMIYDLFILKIDYIMMPYRYLATYVLVTVIPTLSIFFINFKLVNTKFLLKLVYVIYFLFCFLNVTLNKIPESPTRSSGITDLWPIGFGQAGATLSLLSLFIFDNTRKKYEKYIISLGFFLGIIIIMMSGSKTPFLSLIILLILYSILFKIPSLIYFFPTIIITLCGIVYFIRSNSIVIFKRLFESIKSQDESTLERISILNQTLSKIKNNFWFGDSFLIKTDSLNSVYPHNLFLESFMTMGVIGGVLFIFINYFTIRVSFRLLKKREYRWIVFFFYQYFFLIFFSTSIYSSYFYWVSLSIVVASYFIIKNNVQKSI